MLDANFLLSYIKLTISCRINVSIYVAQCYVGASVKRVAV